jgi:hypothetical protein
MPFIKIAPGPQSIAFPWQNSTVIQTMKRESRGCEGAILA